MKLNENWPRIIINYINSHCSLYAKFNNGFSIDASFNCSQFAIYVHLDNPLVPAAACSPLAAVVGMSTLHVHYCKHIREFT